MRGNEPGEAGRVLLVTKLRPPVVRHAVPRARLSTRLEPTARRLTVLDAPAGWGKTTLLAQWWTEHDPTVRVAWLGLDAGDNDPVMFWSYLIAALRIEVPGIGGAALAALHAGHRALCEATIPSIVNELCVLAEPVVIVLDDYHLIVRDQVRATVALLLERLPPSVHLVVSCRGDTSLALGRMQAAGELLELRAADLALHAGEIRQMLAAIPGGELPEAELHRLARRTEGWPAGVALARASLATKRICMSEFLDEFAGTDRYVLDYLCREVLAGQPDDQREFLLQTSILDELSPALCTAVTGRTDAAYVMDRLERARVFLTALDSGRRRYRYHGLFSELLRHELTLTDAASIPSLHRRAADWYAGNGSVTDAIKHYVAAWEPQRAAELAAQHWNDWLNRGFLSTVESWLARLPSELVRGDSRLCAAQALLRLDRGELTGVDPWLAAGDRAADPADPVAARDLAVLRALQRFKIGDLGAASNAARRVLELETGAQCFATTVALLVSGVSAFWAGRPGSAHQSLTSALQMARRTRNTLAETYAMGYLALSLTESGALEQATDAVAAALRVAAAPAVSEHFVACLPHLAAAALQAASGEPGAAVETSGRALALARRGAGQLETAVILGVHARARAAAGEDGSRWLARARAIVRSCPDPGDVSVRLARIRLPGGPRLDETNSRRDVPGTVVLSARERQLLPLLAGSLSQREIGVVLHLSINTVKTHSRVLFRKLGVSSRRAAVARARELELLPTTLPVPQMLSGAHPE